jgi:quercetin dioxygenase-like cupin family protein
MTTEKRGGWDIATDSVKGVKEAASHVYQKMDDLQWEPHPINRNVKLAFILTKRNDGVEVTTLLVRIPKGEGLPEHTHEAHDIIFPLSGKAKIWIKGIGDYELKKGVAVHVPPGILHKLYDVTEDMEIYDVFSGAIL